MQSPEVKVNVNDLKKLASSLQRDLDAESARLEKPGAEPSPLANELIGELIGVNAILSAAMAGEPAMAAPPGSTLALFGPQDPPPIPPSKLRT